jgi:hypothetical protein
MQKGGGSHPKPSDPNACAMDKERPFSGNVKL